MLAFIKCILYALQWDRDRLLDDYKKGSSAPDFVSGGPYVRGDFIVWIDKSIYSYLPLVGFSTIGINAPTGDPDSAITWIKTQDIFIGVDERAKYNSQIIMFEYELNHYYRVPISDPQIYISTNQNNNYSFVMGNTGENSSSMSNNSVYATNFMYNAPSFTLGFVNFTIFFPLILFGTLGLTVADCQNNIRQFANKYKLGGITYDIQTF